MFINHIIIYTRAKEEGTKAKQRRRIGKRRRTGRGGREKTDYVFGPEVDTTELDTQRQQQESG